jgi:hypothetical protein
MTVTSLLFNAGVWLIIISLAVTAVALLTEALGERVPTWGGVLVISTTTLGAAAVAASYVLFHTT